MDNTPKIFGHVWSLSIWWPTCAVKLSFPFSKNSVSAHTQTHTDVHKCMYVHTHTHIHTKKILFSTEINVYSIPNILCVRQYVWSCLHLGMRLRCLSAGVWAAVCVHVSDVCVWGSVCVHMHERWREGKRRTEEHPWLLIKCLFLKKT